MAAGALQQTALQLLMELRDARRPAAPLPNRCVAAPVPAFFVASLHDNVTVDYLAYKYTLMQITSQFSTNTTKLKNAAAYPQVCVNTPTVAT